MLVYTWSTLGLRLVYAWSMLGQCLMLMLNGRVDLHMVYAWSTLGLRPKSIHGQCLGGSGLQLANSWFGQCLDRFACDLLAQRSQTPLLVHASTDLTSP